MQRIFKQTVKFWLRSADVLCQEFRCKRVILSYGTGCQNEPDPEESLKLLTSASRTTIVKISSPRGQFFSTLRYELQL